MPYLELIVAILVATVIVMSKVARERRQNADEYLGLAVDVPPADQVLTHLGYKKKNLVARADRIAARLYRSSRFDRAKKFDEAAQLIEAFMEESLASKREPPNAGRKLRALGRVSLREWFFVSHPLALAADIKTWREDLRAWMDAVLIFGIPAARDKEKVHRR